MNYNEVIKNLEYLISEDCTETQFDYEDEIDIAIRVMKNTNDVYSKIDKAIEEIKELETAHCIQVMDREDIVTSCLEILKRNIESEL